MQTALVILAAGKGSRMKSDLPKVLHKVGGAPLVVHALRAGASLSPAQQVIVVGHGADVVEAAVTTYDAKAVCVRQDQQNGTAHAVDQARDALSGFDGDVIVLYGDTPFISADTLAQMQATRAGGADVIVLGFEAAEPGRYGRLVIEDGRLDRIVEAKDATAEELEITTCNSGVICADRATLFDLISKVGNDNASGEYYLTDIVGLANAAGLTCGAVLCDEVETLGVNSRVELDRAEAIFQTQARQRAMENGVTLAGSETVYFSFDTEIAQDVWVGPNVVFGPGVTVETGAEIHAFSHLESCNVGSDARVGPFARLRPGTNLAREVRVGNFVEIKNAEVAEGAKVNHLTYIGDTDIGAKANIGAGTVTCNYDGVMKHRTKIGAGAFVGSGTLLVAPVEMGDESMTATGTVLPSGKNIPDGALAVGRARVDIKPGFARKLMETLRAKKKKKGT